MEGWAERIRRAVAAAGGGGAFLLVLDDYRTEIARELAAALGWSLLDLRAALAARFGAGAAWASPHALDSLLGEHVSAPGLLAHDAEAVLALQHPLDREAWLRDVLARAWPHPVLLTVPVAADVPLGPRTIDPTGGTF